MKKDLISKYKNKIFTKLQGCYLRSCKYYLKPVREKINGLSVSNSGWNLKRKLLADIKADICGRGGTGRRLGRGCSLSVSKWILLVNSRECLRGNS